MKRVQQNQRFFSHFPSRLNMDVSCHITNVHLKRIYLLNHFAHRR